MTGRQAYEMFTRSFGSLTDYQRKQTQFGDTALVAFDDLGWAEQGAWRTVAKQVDKRIERSVAARRAT
jgi:hypothetical protein